MKSLKKLKQKLDDKSLSKAQTKHVKGGDDKRRGPSVVKHCPPGVDSVFRWLF
jgi:natural product precursor